MRYNPKESPHEYAQRVLDVVQDIMTDILTKTTPNNHTLGYYNRVVDVISSGKELLHATDDMDSEEATAYIKEREQFLDAYRMNK